MIDILALQQALPIVIFAPSSRYASVPTARIDIDGVAVVYVRRRFVPQPESLSVFGAHTVTQGERLDHIASQYLGDPELFWRICDANRALRPAELTDTIGRRLALALPEGVPGVANV